MRLIRDNAEGAKNHILTFGRYRGYQFAETPADYQRWAIKETDANDNASEELRMFANWARENLSTTRTAAYARVRDPEESASIPYTPEDNSTWDLLSLARPKSLTHRGTPSTPPRGTTRPCHRRARTRIP